ncbi:MAG: ABC-2 transporter permease [Lachnospirales bacterium]
MRGLILNDFYKTFNGSKILISLSVLIGAVIVMFMEQQIIVYGYIIGVILCLSLYSLSSVRKDMETKWNRYEVTLPIKRKEIIKSKYIFSLIYLLISLFVTVMFVLAIVAIKEYEYFDFGMKDIITLYILSIALVFQIISFFYMTVYLFSFEYIDIAMIISVVLSLILTGTLVKLLNKRDITIEDGRIIIIVISTFILYISYEVTKKLYRKNDI